MCEAESRKGEAIIFFSPSFRFNGLYPPGHPTRFAGEQFFQGARFGLDAIGGQAVGILAGGVEEATDYIQLFEYNVNLLAGELQQVAGR